MPRAERIYDRHVSKEMVETLVISANGDATLVVGPETESALREGLSRALEFGKGVVHVQPKSRVRLDFPRPARSTFSTKRACPVCSRATGW